MSELIVRNKGRGVTDLLTPIFQIPGFLYLVLKRQLNHLGLTLLSLLGVILTVGLLTNASFFSEAVDRVILLQELGAFTKETGRPPFSTSVYVFPSTRSPLSLENAEQAQGTIARTLSSQVGLPLRQQGLQVSSGGMMLQPAKDSPLFTEGKNYLGDVEAVYIDQVAPHMDIVAGAPLDGDGKSGQVLDVWIHDQLAEKLGAQVGEEYGIGVTLSTEPLPIRIAGIWRAKDPKETFWFTNPDMALKDSLLVRRQDYINFIQPRVPSQTRGAYWYIILDEKSLIPQNSASYIAGYKGALQAISRFLPGVKLNTPPLDPLANFVQRNKTLTIILLGYNLPAFGILLYFLVLIAGIVAEWQRREASVLVSRGMSVFGVLNLTLLDQLILFLIGFPLGVAFGMLIARVMGYSSSFLSFTDREPLPVSVYGLNLSLAVLALSLSLLARLLPARQAARLSVVVEEREWARPMRSPFWYRFYLDLLLILPTYYAYTQLMRRGSIAGLIVDRPEDLYQDPLLILVPALFIVTLSLVTMRLFALVMRMIDVLASLTPSVTFHLALRQLGRQGHEYVRPLSLVIVALALGVYTLSMAASLDRWLVDRMYYRVGADLTFVPMPLVEGATFTDGELIPAPEEFAKVPGVEKATRVGSFPTRITIEGEDVGWGRVMAVDRVDFPQVAWFRSDLARDPLGGLMNLLAINPDGALVSEQFLKDHSLGIGDRFSAKISLDSSTSIDSDFTIAGAYQYFPTVYEDQDGPMIVTSLDYLNTEYGATVKHNLWLKLKPGADGRTVLKDLVGVVHITTAGENNTQEMVATEQAKMERVGIFGTLSVGFLATGAMAILGLLLYSYASLRDRVYRFAVLNAVGLSRGQITAQVVLEYLFLTAFGAFAGAFIGKTAAELFVPFYRYTGERGIPLPPLLPIIQEQGIWRLTLVFALAMIIGEAVIIATAMYRRLSVLLKQIA